MRFFAAILFVLVRYITLCAVISVPCPLGWIAWGHFWGAKELGVSSGGNVAGLRAVNLVEIARRLPLSP